VDAALGVGSNLGDKAANLLRGLLLLDSYRGINVVTASSLYSTPPWGFHHQPSFINGAAIVRTSLSPRQLLAACLQVENRLERVRERHWGPRSLDIDILLFGKNRVREKDLIIPHPLLQERLFVLVPLAEIAHDWVHPPTGEKIISLLAELKQRQPGVYQKIQPAGREVKREVEKNHKQKLASLVKKYSPDGYLTCAAAHKLAEEEGFQLLEIGAAADELGIKITGCQLGCF